MPPWPPGGALDTTRRPRLVLLPGMGATSAMYGDTWRSLSGLAPIDWLPHAGERTVADFAARLVERHRVGPGDVLSGSSFGGMVALAMGRQVGASTVILIGSAEKPDEIHGALRRLAPLAEVTPFAFAQLLAGSSPGALTEQFAASEPGFLRAACSALSRWEGSRFDGHVFRIHGVRDRVIRCPEIGTRIPDAGHLVACTHPEACIGAIQEYLAKRG